MPGESEELVDVENERDEQHQKTADGVEKVPVDQPGDGELVAVVGRSGSRKTTQMNMLAGIDRPTSGIVRAAGVDGASVVPPECGTVFLEQTLEALHRALGLGGVVAPEVDLVLARRPR